MKQQCLHAAGTHKQLDPEIEAKQVSIKYLIVDFTVKI
jgi:hypothetical protein